MLFAQAPWGIRKVQSRTDILKVWESEEKKKKSVAESIGQYMSECIFPGVKWKGRGADHPPQTKAEIKERVELYLSLYPNWAPGPSWPDIW